MAISGMGAADAPEGASSGNAKIINALMLKVLQSVSQNSQFNSDGLTDDSVADIKSAMTKSLASYKKNADLPPALMFPFSTMVKDLQSDTGSQFLMRLGQVMTFTADINPDVSLANYGLIENAFSSGLTGKTGAAALIGFENLQRVMADVDNPDASNDINSMFDKLVADKNGAALISGLNDFSSYLNGTVYRY